MLSFNIDTFNKHDVISTRWLDVGDVTFYLTRLRIAWDLLKVYIET